MKKSQKILSLLLSVLILLSSISVLTAVSAFAADSITYSFSNTKAGFAQGTVTLKGSNGTYWLYWAYNTKALSGMGEVAKVTVSGGQGVFAMPKYTAIPADATKLIAFLSSTEPSESNRTVAKSNAVYSIPASKQLAFSSKDAFYTFGSISDPQLANDDYGSNSYPYDETHLEKALETLALRGVDFTVSSGDTVNDQNGNQTYAAEYKAYQKILADSSYTAPIYEANGNHDVGTKWDKNGNYYNDNAPFIKATGLDSKKSTINAGKPYFEVTEPNTGDHFIFMALEGGFYTNKGTQFSSAQLDWLEGLLKKYKDDGKNIFIIEHANIGGWGSGDKLTTPYYYDLALVKTNSDVARFIKLMETYKDCVIITGHTHLELSAQYNYSDNNGTSAVMIHNSAIGGVRRLVNGSVDRTAVLGMSEGYIVEVYEDCILFNGINMYYNEIMPQCSYIIPMGTSESDVVPTTPEDTTPKPTQPATDKITITLKDTTDSGWMSNNASEREIQLIDNDTNTKYVMTSTDGYKTWTVQVDRSVTDITFRRVRTSNGEIRNQWDAGERKGSVQYCVQDDAGGGTTTGKGYWNTAVTEPPVPTQPTTAKPQPTTAKPQPTTQKPVVTDPVETVKPTEPTTQKPVVTDPVETVKPTEPTTQKPVVTDPVETVKPTEPTTQKPVVTMPTPPVVIPTIPVPTIPDVVPTIPVTASTTTSETVVSSTAATVPSSVAQTQPVATTTATVPQLPTEPVFKGEEPLVVVEVYEGTKILVSAFDMSGEGAEFQFAVNGVVYQDFSENPYFFCDVPYDFTYLVTVSAKYKSGEIGVKDIEFEVKDGSVILPEMPEKPTNPVVPTTSVVTTATATTTAVAASSGVETFATETATQATSAPVQYLYGDSDLNGKINVKDATTIQKYAAKIIALEGVAFTQADVTGDMKVNVKDATQIQKLIAKLIDKFPVDELALVSVGASATAQQDLDSYYTFSSYDQYMALKKASKTSASQSVIASCQQALYDIAGAKPEEAGEITVYFSDAKGWGTVYAHIWGSGGDKTSWPGTKMTYVRQNSSGQNIYKVTLDFSLYQKIIFHNNVSGTQTVDITLSGENNIGYYVSGGSGKTLTVTSYQYS